MFACLSFIRRCGVLLAGWVSGLTPLARPASPGVCLFWLFLRFGSQGWRRRLGKPVYPVVVEYEIRSVLPVPAVRLNPLRIGLSAQHHTINEWGWGTHPFGLVYIPLLLHSFSDADWVYHHPLCELLKDANLPSWSVSKGRCLRKE